ncbi:MAG: DNA repair protein RecN, partial [Gordonia sp. (in: high G+C Gram-positive bacteria)]
MAGEAAVVLEEISISGLGVIDKAGAEFHEGLTVLTGETGAGKTMVVTSLHLLSGARADAGRVRSGQARAVVEGRFRATGPDAAEVLDSSGAELDEDGTVIAVRTVNADGRSRAHLGGRSVPVGLLGQFTSGQLAIHGQNDQLRLLRAEHQRDALDRFAAEAVTKPLKAYREARDR